MILIGMGANLPHDGREPVATIDAALDLLAAAGAPAQVKSRWYQTPAWPAGSGQPNYVNGVAALATDLEPVPLLALLHDIERQFGRRREGEARWAARTLDLDLLDYHGRVLDPGPDGQGPELPHPRIAGRAFVLVPLAQIAPDWRHPVTGQGVADLLAGCGESIKDVHLLESSVDVPYQRLV